MPSSKSKPFRTVALDSRGFHIRESDTSAHVDWSSVKEIVAFKRDLFSYDEICLGFRVDETDSYVEIWESDAGYQQLVSELPRHYPGIPPNWFAEIAHPAFATNWTTLWGEPLQPQKT